MKKSMLIAVFALGTLTAIQAQEIEVEVQNPTNAVEKVEVTAQKAARLLAKAEVKQVTFKEIKVSELPTLVVEALAKDFEGATVQNAYINEKQEFKLVLATTADDAKAATRTVYATKNGEWIKEPKTMIK